MPTYDYKCLDCDHTFEEFQKMTDQQLQICPNCEGKLKRLIGAGIAPIFKGSGFYQTDYKNSSAPKDGDKSKNTAEKKDSSPKKENKTEKPASKD